MKKTLICTVGGSHQPIVTAIETLRPDYVCFVCSRDDPATKNKGSHTQVTGKGPVIKASFSDGAPSLPNIPTQTGLQENQFEVLAVYPDNLDDIYARVSDWISRRDLDTEEVIADYTGGTKTMSAGLVLAAIDDERVTLQLVTGNRANLNKVATGAESVSPATVTKSRFRRHLNQALAAWKRFAYDESLSLLQAIRKPRDPELAGELLQAIDLSRAFSAWDRFDHATAKEILNAYRPALGRHWGALLGTIDLIENKERGEPLRIFDLWRNAQRRAHQGHYDDAVARAYRLLEWTAQWILRVSANIETHDIPEDKIPPSLELTPNRQGKYQAGLFDAWALAAHYGGDRVSSFWNIQREKMLNYLQARNHSILAHGFSPLKETDWTSFSQWIEQEVLPLLLHFSQQEPFRISKLPAQLPQGLPGEQTA